MHHANQSLIPDSAILKGSSMVDFQTNCMATERHASWPVVRPKRTVRTGQSSHRSLVPNIGDETIRTCRSSNEPAATR